jgi:ABC-2 type transport system ATP-binding protein
LERGEIEEGDQVWRLTLNSGVDAQTVLRACVDAGIKLSRFEPRRPHLHDAFVTLVGETAEDNAAASDQSNLEEV